MLEGVIKNTAEVVAVSPMEPAVVVIHDCNFEVAMAEKKLAFTIPNVVKFPRLIVYEGVEQQLEPLGPLQAQQTSCRSTEKYTLHLLGFLEKYSSELVCVY